MVNVLQISTDRVLPINVTVYLHSIGGLNYHHYTAQMKHSLSVKTHSDYSTQNINCAT